MGAKVYKVYKVPLPMHGACECLPDHAFVRINITLKLSLYRCPFVILVADFQY
jgi:hypothetical protein